MAAKSGSIESIYLLLNKGGKITSKYLKYSSWGGNIDIIKLGLTVGLSPSMKHFEICMSRGYLDAAKFFISLGVGMGRRAIIYALINGHIDCVNWAHSNHSDISISFQHEIKDLSVDKQILYANMITEHDHDKFVDMYIHIAELRIPSQKVLLWLSMRQRDFDDINLCSK